jgi:ankyrin repeat protein
VCAETFAYLLKYHANVDKLEILILAAINGHLEMVKYLVEKLNVPVNNNGLYLIAENGYVDVLKYLIDKGACLCRTHLETALNRSATNGHLEMVKYLVEEHNAAVNDYVLLLSAKKSHLDVIKYLVIYDLYAKKAT